MTDKLINGEIQLLRPDKRYARQVMEFKKELNNNGDSFDGCAGLEECDSFEEWLRFEERLRAKYKEGYVPSEVFLAVWKKDNYLVGIIDYRHPLTDFLLKYGGNIGYSVRSSERRKGYATEMLRLLLDICRSYGDRRVLVTCDRDNIASMKTILSNGGELENEVEDTVGLSRCGLIQRYWVPTGGSIMKLETERLILRRWEDSDAESLYEYAKDPDVGPIAGWPVHQSVEESLDVIRNVFNGREAYAVCLKTDKKAIGAIELKLNGHTDMTNREDECELGYWLGKPFWGQGIMPEAVGEMLRHVFEDLGMSKIWVGYYEGNTKSKRVQEKCGFRYQWKTEEVDVPLMHEKRTGHVSSLTKEEWLARNQSEMTE